MTGYYDGALRGSRVLSTEYAAGRKRQRDPYVGSRRNADKSKKSRRLDRKKKNDACVHALLYTAQDDFREADLYVFSPSAL